MNEINVHCEQCGGTLINTHGAEFRCDHCGLVKYFETIYSTQVVALINQANSLRNKGEFDDAYDIFKSVLSYENNNADAYWGMLLCTYGVMSVLDPATNAYVPTCNRCSEVPVMQNENYKNAIKFSGTNQQENFAKSAQKIESIRRQSLELSKNNQSYDIFICYKRTVSIINGREVYTEDSVCARDIYDILTNQGYKVFFAEKSLQNLAGSKYEPIIYNALKTSKVMLLISSDTEFINAPWVKNEWRRFIKQMEYDQSKILIPILFNGFKAPNLPDILKKYQALEVSPSFQPNLINIVSRAVKKQQTVQPKTYETTPKQKQIQNAQNYALQKKGKSVKVGKVFKFLFGLLIIWLAGVSSVFYFTWLSAPISFLNKIFAFLPNPHIATPVLCVIMFIIGFSICKNALKKGLFVCKQCASYKEMETVTYSLISTKKFLWLTFAKYQFNFNCDVCDYLKSKTITVKTSTKNFDKNKTAKKYLAKLYGLKEEYVGGSSNPSYVSKKFSKFAKALAYLCVFAISVGSIACQGFRINEVSYGEYENSAIKQIELGANVYYIGDCAFSCSQLESITMPSVEIIGSNAFSGCQNLTNITFSEDLQEIGSYAFNGCTKLTSIRLPAGSDFIINHSAFSSCESLTEVVFVEEFETANGVFQIGAKAFDQCRSLKEIQLPRNLERINEGLFYSCTSLEKVYFRRNSQLSGIYHNAFYGCSSLKEIVIPSKVNDVDSSAFSSCGKLQKIYFEGVEEDFNDIKGDLYSDSNKPQVQDATVYYYSQTEPTEAGNFWHYVNDVPTIWA